MKDHYDFSKGVRGKFYKPDAVFRLLVYLDETLRDLHRWRFPLVTPGGWCGEYEPAEPN